MADLLSELARDIDRACRLTGTFTLRSGQVATEYFDKYLFESDPALLAHGPEAVLYAILDQVVDEYEPVVKGLENDIDEIENAYCRLVDETTSAELARYTLKGGMPFTGVLMAVMSRSGGAPNRRLYSRLNCDGLS